MKMKMTVYSFKWLVYSSKTLKKIKMLKLCYWAILKSPVNDLLGNHTTETNIFKVA